MSAPIPSPCVMNCCLDKDDICLGCFRHIDEIKLWANPATSDSEKEHILTLCQQRKKNKTLFAD